MTPAKLKLMASLLLLQWIIFTGAAQEVAYPGIKWTEKAPGDLGLNEEKLDSITSLLGGRGCIIKDGYLVKKWGDQEEKSDWMSSAKPVFSTFLFFAVEEGKIPDVHYKISNLGWDLQNKDQDIEFYHLANMISGYRRPEGPGEAWAYNDYAIQLYQKSLFDRLYQETPEEVLYNLLGPLRFEDHPTFNEKRRRFYASVRDFGRIGWFWVNRGKWKEMQLLPEKYFKEYARAQVPENLPHTGSPESDDYLGIGTFGGGSDHFTKFGAGIYGFNWWFNGYGRLHPESKTWPDAPDDTFMSIGFGGNNMVMIPSMNMVLSSAKGNWGDLDAGNPESTFNIVMRLLAGSSER